MYCLILNLKLHYTETKIFRSIIMTKKKKVIDVKIFLQQ